MAYDPTNFFNNGTLVGVAGNVNAPGGQGTWVIVNGVASYYPPNSTAYIPGSGITITGTAPVLTIANAGVVDLVQGSITAAGVIDIGANLTLNAGGTLSGSAGGGGSLGVNYAGTIYPTVAAGAEISLSGAAGILTIASEGITAEVGTIFSSFNTLVAGSEITFSGTSPDLTISSAGGSGGITEFVQGTITATGTATVGTGLTLTGTTNPTLTAGTAAGTIGVEFGGTLYPTLAAGSGFTLTGSGATLTGSASGGGGGFISITDGINTEEITQLVVNNLNLMLSSSSPVLVQTAMGVGSGTIQFSSNTTANNLIVAMVGYNNAPTMTGYTQQFNFGGFNGVAAFTKSATGTLETLTGVGDSSVYIVLYEFSNVGGTSVQYPLTISNPGGGSVITAPVTVGVIDSIILTVLHNGNGSATGNTPEPAGSSLDASYQTGGTEFFLRSPVVENSTITIGLTINPFTTVTAGSLLVIGESSGAATITPNIPTTINGTFAGDFETMTITTGNTATSVSISGTSLILNLGTP